MKPKSYYNMKISQKILKEIENSLSKRIKENDRDLLNALLIHLGLYEIPVIIKKIKPSNRQSYWGKYLKSFGYIGKGFYEYLFNTYNKIKCSENFKYQNKIIILHNFHKKIFIDNILPIFNYEKINNFQEIIFSSHKVEAMREQQISLTVEVGLIPRLRWLFLRSQVSSKLILQNVFGKFDLPTLLKLSSILNWLFFYYLPSLESLLIAAKRVSKKNKIYFSICADQADPKGRLLNNFFNSIGVPTYIIQQGLTSAKYLDWYDCKASKIFCINERQRLLINSQGVDLKSIYVTGAVWMPDKPISTDRKTKRILFGTQPYVPGAFSSRANMFRALNKTIELIINNTLKTNNTVYRFSIKIHPSEKINDYKWLAQLYPQIDIYNDNVEILDLFEDTVLYLTFTSQTTFQALAMGVPVINISFKSLGIDETAYEEFDNNMGQQRAKNLSELKKALETFFDVNSQKQHLFEPPRKNNSKYLISEFLKNPVKVQ